MLSVLAAAKRYKLRIPKFVCFKIIYLSDYEFHYTFDLMSKYPYEHILPRVAAIGNFPVIKKILTERPDLAGICFKQICEFGNIGYVAYVMRYYISDLTRGLHGAIKGGHGKLLSLFNENLIKEKKSSLIISAYKGGHIAMIDLLVNKYGCDLEIGMEYANFTKANWNLFNKIFDKKIKRLCNDDLLVYYIVSGNLQGFKNKIKAYKNSSFRKEALRIAVYSKQTKFIEILENYAKYDPKFLIQLIKRNDLNWFKVINEKTPITKKIDYLLLMQKIIKHDRLNFYLCLNLPCKDIFIFTDTVYKFGSFKILQYYLENTFHENEVLDKMLLAVCSYGYLDLVKLLIQHGAVPNNSHYEKAVNNKHFVVANYIK